jgi:hypothetical protein
MHKYVYRRLLYLLQVLAGLMLAFVPDQTSARNYYVDSRSGEDKWEGTSPATAWRTFTNLSRRSFQPGDSILFRKGACFTGGFVFSSSGSPQSPIVFSSYGNGPKPAFSNPWWNILNGNIFQIHGSYVVISDLYFHDNALPPSANSRDRNVQKMGAVYFGLTTRYDRISGCEFYHTPVGVKVKGHYTKVTGNYFHDADSISRTWGAIAIMVVSSHNEIAYNRIAYYGYYGGAYGSDGGAIELDGVDSAFDAREICIHHNVSIGNHGFLEIAGRHVDSIVIAFNLSDDVDKFVGVGNMMNVLIINNTVIRRREPNIDRFVFWTFDRDNTHCIVRNNLFVLPKDIQVFGPLARPVGHKRTGFGYQPHDHNLYFVPVDSTVDPIGIPPGPGDRIANPLFLDVAHDDFHLTEGSPARHGGTTEGLPETVVRQLAGKQPDIGAF